MRSNPWQGLDDARVLVSLMTEAANHTFKDALKVARMYYYLDLTTGEISPVADSSLF